jgi:hypothetical protein
MTIRVEMHGEYPSYVEKCFGTTAEILAHTPTVRMAEGFSTDGGGQGTWVAENDTWVGFTNAPGSPPPPSPPRGSVMRGPPRTSPPCSLDGRRCGGRVLRRSTRGMGRWRRIGKAFGGLI